MSAADGESFRSYKFDKIEVVPLPHPSVRTDDALGNKLTIDPGTHRDVVTLIQSIPAMSARPRTSAAEPYEDFLRASSPEIDEPEPAILPIFPRDQRLDCKRKESWQEVKSFSESLGTLANRPESWLVPVQVKDEEEEEDMANEHLILVDGWHAFKTPSSPLTPGTPSLADTSSDIDELFLPSSSMPYTEELQPLEEYQIPRCEKIGGSRSQPKPRAQDTNLSAFLSPLIQPSQVHGPRIVCSPKSKPSSPQTTISMSMLGQPPSVVDDLPRAADSPSRTDRPVDDGLSSDDSITFAMKVVERACDDRLGDQNPIALILEERLDEKDGMLMNVPTLRPPNEHPRELLLPDRLSDLIVLGRSGNPNIQAYVPCIELPMGCIKKAKGLGSLQIELSWIPFKYGPTVPTDEEVADVENDPCPQLAKAIDLPQDEIVSSLALLLDESMAFSSQPLATAAAHSDKVWSADDQPAILRLDCSLGDLGLVLSRGDRRRLAGLPAFSEVDEDTGSDKENECEHEARPPSDKDRPVKRVRFQDPTEPQATDPTVDMICDDSGVFMVDQDMNEDTAQPKSDESCSFSQLAYDAEGFDGPIMDGNLFPDMHPVYYDEYNFDMSPRQYVLDPYAAPTPSPLDLLADHCTTQAEEDTAAEDGFLPQEPCQEPMVLAGTLPEPSEVTSQDLPETFARLSHRQRTATDAMVPTSTEGTTRSAAAAALPTLSARQSIEQFLTFCGKGSLVQSTTAAPASPQPKPASYGTDIRKPRTTLREAPEELLDDRTLLLPDDYKPPTTVHRYMASMAVIQKRALVRALDTYCAVGFIERERLGEDADDVHVIMDCETAVLFFSLEMLPSGGDALATLLTRLSWRYTRLLVIFECYPSVWDYRGDRDFAAKPTASAWSPPVVKAVRKLRRDLSISEGVQTKSAATLVEYAFANTVEEAAALTRLYGDVAEAQDQTSGAIWGERLWLTHEERDGEYDLCGIPGMNLFAASLLLSQTTIEEFLEKTASERLVEYGPLVGTARVERFNVEMAYRLDTMQLPPSSPIDAHASSSSLTSVPYIGDSGSL
ncbi:hypothetical protein L227DRAFT_607705 [Lentinus tigrinus ALCF2SS1-6]|uniref:Uncharacterized protein n=1 Tax=Lentinus tigrinus ALCF2SS1-6 TaxID=1328759 RepID=A0A5C2SNB8_9APHY|nr:hypothetical protein L227DRAFT_607705 [Lentinus tigrinus ALCF2SS1-6]